MYDYSGFSLEKPLPRFHTAFSRQNTYWLPNTKTTNAPSFLNIEQRMFQHCWKISVQCENNAIVFLKIDKPSLDMMSFHNEEINKWVSIETENTCELFKKMNCRWILIFVAHETIGLTVLVCYYFSAQKHINRRQFRYFELTRKERIVIKLNWYQKCKVFFLILKSDRFFFIKYLASLRSRLGYINCNKSREKKEHFKIPKIRNQSTLMNYYKYIITNTKRREKKEAKQGGKIFHGDKRLACNIERYWRIKITRKLFALS